MDRRPPSCPPAAPRPPTPARRRRRPHHRLAFCDRVLVTLVILRFQLPHQALAVLYGVDRATITRAIHQVRPLLARRGFAVPDQPDVRLHTLADVFADAAAHGSSSASTPPRPRSGGHGPTGVGGGRLCPASASSSTSKTTTISDPQGRTLWAGAVRPGRTHDQTAEGSPTCCASTPPWGPWSTAATGAWPRRSATNPRPTPKPRKQAPAEQIAVYQIARKQ